jgi:hypothetical protein
VDRLSEPPPGLFRLTARLATAALKLRAIVALPSLVKQHHIVTHCNRLLPELDSQPAAQRLGVEQPLRKRFNNKDDFELVERSKQQGRPPPACVLATNATYAASREVRIV